MAPLSDEEREAVKEALDEQMRKEPFERALGKVLRRRGMDFERYVIIVSEVREESKRQKPTLEEAARMLATSEKERA